MPTPPRTREWDATVALLREGYPFISRRCDQPGSDLVRTRLRLGPCLLMRGREAAELFYDESRFRRGGAIPNIMLGVLQGKARRRRSTTSRTGGGRRC